MARTVGIGYQDFARLRMEHYIDHPPKAVWKDFEHEYGRTVFFSELFEPG